MRPHEDALCEILAAGIQAPSAENHHYFRYAIESDRVRLVGIESATWSTLPHRQMLTRMAFGAVIENVALKSLEFGHAVQVDLRPDPAHSDVIATLRWAPVTSATSDPLAAAIASRHTNRRFYRREPVASSVLDELQRATATIAGASLRWLDAPALRRSALTAIRVAETERFRRPALHEELFGAVRFEIGWRRTVDEWLAPATLEVEAPARPVFAALRSWKTMRVANMFGAYAALGLRAGHLPAASAPHLGLLLAGGDEDADAINAGRALQRVWLATTLNGLAFQPMAAATALALQVPGEGWVSADAQTRLRALLAELRGDARGAPRMLFRLGRASQPSAVAGRRPLHSYIT